MRTARLCLHFAGQPTPLSHKIAGGQHLPNLALILRLASALKTSPGGLVDLAAAQLSD